MKFYTKNASRGEKTNNNQVRYCRGLKKPRKMFEETNMEELVALPKSPKKTNVERLAKDIEEKTTAIIENLTK
jgi:hypothetical protein